MSAYVFSCFFFLNQVVKKNKEINISCFKLLAPCLTYRVTEIIFLSEYIKRITLIDSLDLNSWIFLQNISSMRTGIWLFFSLEGTKECRLLFFFFKALVMWIETNKLNVIFPLFGFNLEVFGISHQLKKYSLDILLFSLFHVFFFF